LSELVGGAIRIAGGSPTTVTAASPSTSWITVNAIRVPFFLSDDDDKHDDGSVVTSVLPVQVSQPQLIPDSILRSALEQCFILVDIDGGNTVANCMAEVMFSANETLNALQGSFMTMQSPARAAIAFNGLGSFWMAYAAFAYQERDDFSECNTGDWDPDDMAPINGETTVFGGTIADQYSIFTPYMTIGGNASWVFMEAEADYRLHPLEDAPTDAQMVARVFAHEIGHQLGLGHTNETHQQYIGTLMAEFPFDDDLSAFHQNLLRLRYQPVGSP
jgi:hypothetical protein